MPLERSDPRQVYAQARIAAAERVLERGKLFCTDPRDEHWFDFLDAIADIRRLERSPLARQTLGLHSEHN
jgi:hypothetical protein